MVFQKMQAHAFPKDISSQTFFPLTVLLQTILLFQTERYVHNRIVWGRAVCLLMNILSGEKRFGNELSGEELSDEKIFRVALTKEELFTLF
jgi:hypothetical protein